MRVLFFSSAKSIKLFTTLSIILIKSSYWELAVGLFYAFVKKKYYVQPDVDHASILYI